MKAVGPFCDPRVGLPGSRDPHTTRAFSCPESPCSRLHKMLMLIQCLMCLAGSLGGTTALLAQAMATAMPPPSDALSDGLGPPIKEVIVVGAGKRHGGPCFTREGFGE
jgi:hypothetical protein